MDGDEKMKRIKAIGIGLVIAMIFSLAIATTASANTPYNVIGYVKVNGIYTNGVTVTLYNNRTGETLTPTNQSTLTTYAGASHNGFFQGNLGNLDAQWQANDLIRVNATYSGSTGRTTFNVTETGNLYSYANISFSHIEGGGGSGIGGSGDTGDTGGGWSIDLTGDASFLIILIIILAVVVLAALMHESEKNNRRRR